MSLKIKRIQKTESYESLRMPFPTYLTDEFQVWHYALLDSETVLVVSPNTCQVQTFAETFNGKYSVEFDELQPCSPEEFQEIYAHTRLKIYQADQKYQASTKETHVTLPQWGREGEMRAAS